MEQTLNMVSLVITKANNTLLLTLISKEEVQKSIFQLGAIMAPGLDGYSWIFFYQKYWSIVEETVMKEVQQFFFISHLKSKFCDTNVVLIPKIENPKEVSTSN